MDVICPSAGIPTWWNLVSFLKGHLPLQSPPDNHGATPLVVNMSLSSQSLVSSLLQIVNRRVLVSLLSSLPTTQSSLTPHVIIHPFTPIHTLMGGAKVPAAHQQ